MAVAYNPKIVTNGLVLYLDAANIKSYGGINYVSYSNYNSITWTNYFPTNATLTTGIVAPDGTATAVRITCTSGGNSLLRVAFPSFTPNGTSNWTVSFYVRKVSGSIGVTNFDLADATPSADYTSSLITGEWVRVQSSAVSTAVAKSFVDLLSDGARDYVLDFWGLQIEPAFSASQLTTTTGSVATANVNLWRDLTSNGLTGTFSNSPLYDGSNQGNLSFNGTNASVNLPNSSLLQFLNRNPYSFEVWVYPRTDTSASYPGFINRESNPGSGRDGYNIYYTKLGQTVGTNLVATERFGTGTQNSVGTTLTDAVFFNNWQCYCTTYNGTTLSFYRNGSLIGSIESTGNVTNTVQVVTIGQRGGIYSDSKIATTKFYNTALTATEVSQNFNALRSRYGI